MTVHASHTSCHINALLGYPVGYWLIACNVSLQLQIKAFPLSWGVSRLVMFTGVVFTHLPQTQKDDRKDHRKTIEETYHIHVM